MYSLSDLAVPTKNGIGLQGIPVLMVIGSQVLHFRPLISPWMIMNALKHC